jgi:hypothetical protein
VEFLVSGTSPKRPFPESRNFPLRGSLVSGATVVRVSEITHFRTARVSISAQPSVLGYQNCFAKLSFDRSCVVRTA